MGMEMAREKIMKKKKFTVKNILVSLGISILGSCFFFAIGGLFAFLPDPYNPSKEMIAIVIILSICFIVCGFFSYQFDFFWARVGGGICMSGMFLIPAIRGISSFFPNWLLWSLPLFTAFILVWLLPVINPRLARRIHEEQFGPSTPLGKGCLTLLLGLIGSAGALGALFGAFSLRLTGSANLAMIFIGIMFSFLSVALAQTFAAQLWKQHQFEKVETQKNTQDIK
jgi:hypothetical protein